MSAATGTRHRKEERSFASKTSDPELGNCGSSKSARRFQQLARFASIRPVAFFLASSVAVLLVASSIFLVLSLFSSAIGGKTSSTSDASTVARPQASAFAGLGRANVRQTGGAISKEETSGLEISQRVEADVRAKLEVEHNDQAVAAPQHVGGAIMPGAEEPVNPLPNDKWNESNEQNMAGADQERLPNMDGNINADAQVAGGVSPGQAAVNQAREKRSVVGNEAMSEHHEGLQQAQQVLAQPQNLSPHLGIGQSGADAQPVDGQISRIGDQTNCFAKFEPGRLGYEKALCITDEFFFDITIDNVPIGRLVIGVFGTVVPNSAANFRALATCTGMFSDEDLCFKGDGFHRVVKDFVVQGGSKATGRSIFGGTFREEMLPEHHSYLSHAEKGTVSWAEYPIGSQFFISVAPHSLAYLDKNHVVFGIVTDGISVLEEIASVKTGGDIKEQPLKRVVIANCGDVHAARLARA